MKSQQKSLTSAAKHGTIKVRCTCEHEFQDSRYGKGIRIANLRKAGTESSCTVCGKTH